jgi:hypothetical protein
MTTQITDYQEKLNQQFLNYCEASDFEGIKNLVEETIKARESKFHFFTKLFGKEKPTIDFFADNNGGLKALSKNGDFQILNYIHSSPLFLEQLNDKEKHRIPDYFECFVLAGANGHTKCAELLVPFISNHNNYFLSVYHDFKDACRAGDLNAVKFLVETPLIRINALGMINSRYSEFQPYAEPFLNACEGGHLHIVQYFTSDPNLTEKINLDLIDDTVCINNPKIIEHFIFDLNLPKDHSFLKLIYNNDGNENKIIKKLLKIRENFQELSSELDINPSSPKLQKVKKI